MAGETPITIVGNIVADPELRFTPSGAAVCNFRVASTPRIFNKNSNQYEDGEAVFLTVNVWRQAAENVAESLSKGMRVIVHGNLKQRSYETREGEKRSVYEIEADEVGPSLTFAKADVQRTQRSNNNFNNQGQQNQQQNQQQGTGWNNQQQPQGGFSNQQQPQGGFSGNQTPDNDPWNSAPPQGGFSDPDQPPY
ncbi:SSB protein [Corynebacterium phage PSonyx]|nr:SSB protein [Corynebacterium phage PSonyx]